MKKSLISFLIFINCFNLVSQEKCNELFTWDFLSELIQTTPEDRANKLSLLLNCNESNDFNGTHTYSSVTIFNNGEEYVLHKSATGPPHWNTGARARSNKTFYLHKYYRDKDNDGFADSSNDFVYFYHEVSSATLIEQPYGYSLTYHVDEYEEGFLENNRKYLLKNANNDIEEFITSKKNILLQ